MNRISIFVDAGYLFAQGSVALMGEKRNRVDLRLEIAPTLEALATLAKDKAPDTSLLRIYWYDGTGYKGPTEEQKELASTDNVKLRVGLINRQGKQKGVDALIITDLIDLSRNRAISDALILSGDEDIRIGVLIAQSFGVRVHLLGIEPGRGSQSLQLRQEADTLSEWTADAVRGFLHIVAPAAATTGSSGSAQDTGGVEAVLDQIAVEVFATLTSGEIESLRESLSTSPGIPRDLDGRLLGKARDAIERDLYTDEKRSLRDIFRAKARQAT